MRHYWWTFIISERLLHFYELAHFNIVLTNGRFSNSFTTVCVHKVPEALAPQCLRQITHPLNRAATQSQGDMRTTPDTMVQRGKNDTHCIRFLPWVKAWTKNIIFLPIFLHLIWFWVHDYFKLPKGLYYIYIIYIYVCVYRGLISSIPKRRQSCCSPSVDDNMIMSLRVTWWFTAPPLRERKS